MYNVVTGALYVNTKMFFIFITISFKYKNLYSTLGLLIINTFI